jgi:hypothetical protein
MSLLLTPLQQKRGLADLRHEFVSARLCDIVLKVFQACTELEEQELRQLTGEIANGLRETAAYIVAYGEGSSSERAAVEDAMSLELVRAPDGKDFIRSKSALETVEAA